MSVTDSLTTYGRRLVVGGGGARNNPGQGRGRGRGGGGGLGLGGGQGGRGRGRGGGGGADGTWTPADNISDTYIWLDPRDLTGWSLVSGGPEIFVAGNKGSAGAYNTGVPSQRPDRLPTGINGFPAVEFVEANGTYLSNNTPGNFPNIHTAAGGFSFYALVSNVSTPVAAGLLLDGGAGAANTSRRGVSVYISTNGQVIVYVTNGVGGQIVVQCGTALNFLSSSGPTILSITCSPGAATASRCFIRRNGESPSGVNTGTATPSATVNPSVGTWIGATSGSVAQKFDGLLGEAIFRLGADSDAVRQQYEGYLAHRFEAESLLASGHPYKNFAP